MSLLLAPLFAQLVSLQVGDRTEARYVTVPAAEITGSNVPFIGLNVIDRRTSLFFSYAPSLFLAPLDRTPRQLYVFHLASANASYGFRRTQLTLVNTFGFGTLNFKLLGVQGQQAPNSMNGAPAAPGDAPPMTGTPATGTPTTGTPMTGTPTTGTPTTGTPTTGVTRPDITDKKVRYFTVSNSLGLTQQISKQVAFSAQAGTTFARGLDDESLKFYTPLRGWFVGANTGYVYKLTPRETFTSTLALTKIWSSNDNEAATLNAIETWGHQFGKHSSGWLGAGLNITRFSQASGLRGFSIFPTFNTGVSYQARLGRGALNLGASAYASPSFDPLRALVDPRVGVGAFIGYTRKKLSVTTTTSASLSVAPDDNNTGAVNASQAEIRAGYQLGAFSQVDTGARVSYQTYQTTPEQRDTVLPLNWSAFVGLSFGHQLQIAGGRK
jgi:hypothetical protein